MFDLITNNIKPLLKLKPDCLQNSHRSNIKVFWDFMFLVIEKFGFPKYFINWVKTFYNNITSCTINNGNSSGYFRVERGVRQGDPLSPYLFVLVVEIMAVCIRMNKKIVGIKVGSHDFKLVQCADDTVGILKDVKSAKHFMKVIEEFGQYSGLNLNRDKCEGMWLGKNRSSKKQPLGIEWPEIPIRFLGAYVSYDEKAANEMNLYRKLGEAEKTLNLWRLRNLSLLGRIQIAKTFLFSKFQYFWSNNTVPKEFLRRLNKILFTFIWNGRRERIKRIILMQELFKGGLNAPHVESIIHTSRISWMRRFLNTEDRPWKILFHYNMEKICPNLNILLNSNIDLSKYSTDNIPLFYLEILKSYVLLRKELFQKLSVNDQIIWHNKQLKKQGNNTYCVELYNSGVVTGNDLLDNDGNVKPFDYWSGLGVPGSQFINWYSLATWAKKNGKTNRDHSIEPLAFQYYNGSFIDVAHSSSIKVYNYFRTILLGSEINIPKVGIYTPDLVTDYSKIYVLPNCTCLDVKSRAFQYKFVNNILINNYWLHKWKIKDSNLCTFCHSNVESLIHLYWFCNKVDNFWTEVEIWCNNQDIRFEKRKEYVLYGQLNTDTIVNLVLILGKQYIYWCRNNEQDLSLVQFKMFMWKYARIEYMIAKKNNKVFNFERRWKPYCNSQNILTYEDNN